ncbi:hypothetical protein [Clostridium sp. B9]|uniref:hypothetical protein n=1 Tax=Clostridium sp. B9 TaxID=3423224 RepID=UPI003D2EF279
MNELILKRCKYCDQKYTGSSESICCSDTCQDKYSKYINLRKKAKIPLNSIYITLMIILLISYFFYPNAPLTPYCSLTSILIIYILEIIFPFGEDEGLKKRGVRKTKILRRFLWSIALIYFSILYFKAI